MTGTLALFHQMLAYPKLRNLKLNPQSINLKQIPYQSLYPCLSWFHSFKGMLQLTSFLNPISTFQDSFESVTWLLQHQSLSHRLFRGIVKPYPYLSLIFLLVALLFKVKPGITCTWQISGRSDIDYSKRVELDLNYAENRNLFIDFKILFLTIFALFRKGARWIY